MQLAQTVQSSDPSFRVRETSDNTTNIFPLKIGINPESSDPKRISERQQQVLLLLVGALWMGVSLASLTFAALSVEPKAAAGDAKVVPSGIAKPAGYVVPATPAPAVQPSKA